MLQVYIILALLVSTAFAQSEQGAAHNQNGQFGQGQPGIIGQGLFGGPLGSTGAPQFGFQGGAGNGNENGQPGK
uniref:Uncharacterized protein n=1 Tax=Caenorhabditis japonica TaxID=281687 RepID=A0A8R1ISG8_CAEJA